jgi:hypothetical protein
VLPVRENERFVREQEQRVESLLSAFFRISSLEVESEKVSEPFDSEVVQVRFGSWVSFAYFEVVPPEF